MDAFATVADLNARRETPLSTSQKNRATSLLSDASAMLAAMLDGAGISYSDAVDPLKTNLVSVTCAMVQRAMKSEDMAGITNQSQTSGPYSQSFTYANPSGNLYVTSAEKRTLGVGKSHIGFIRPSITIGGVAVDNW